MKKSKVDIASVPVPVSVPVSVPVPVIISLSLLDRVITFLRDSFCLAVSVPGFTVPPFPVLYLLRYAFAIFLSTVSIKTGTVYGIRRSSFLGFLCSLWNISPSLSYKSNKGKNATESTYGSGIVGRFPAVFDSDGIAYRYLCLTAVSCFDVGTFKVMNIKKHNLFIFTDADTFERIINSPLNVDIEMLEVPGEISPAILSRFRDNVRQEEIDRLSPDIFPGSLGDVLTR